MIASTAAAPRWVVDRESREALPRVERHLARVALSEDTSSIAADQLLSPCSKRLRPLLALLAARITERRISERAVRAAAAVELFHEGTLCHDDIVDDDAYRRGISSPFGSNGARMAAIAGTELLFRAVQLSHDLPGQARVLVSDAADTVCRGQLRELAQIGNPYVSVRERLEVMSEKTAKLFRLSAALGCAPAATPPIVRALLDRYSYRLGMAFQLADDLADFGTHCDALRRDSGSDVRSGVFTLPLLFALEKDSLVRSELLGTIAASNKGSSQHLQVVVALVDHAGGFDRSYAALNGWLESARTTLRLGCSLFPPSVYRSLVELTHTVSDSALLPTRRLPTRCQQ